MSVDDQFLAWPDDFQWPDDNEHRSDNDDVKIVRVNSFFHARSWGEIFISYVAGNQALFERRIVRQITKHRVTEEPLSEKYMKDNGWNFVDYTRKFIQKRYDKDSSDVFETYKYESDPMAYTMSQQFTWDLAANRVMLGWKRIPQVDGDASEKGLKVLSAICSELETDKMRHLCRALQLPDNVITRTYVGYEFTTNLSDIILSE